MEDKVTNDNDPVQSNQVPSAQVPSAQVPSNQVPSDQLPLAADHDPETRARGLLPTPVHVKMMHANAADLFPRAAIIPESQYQEISSVSLITHTLDQDGQGACVGFSGNDVLMIGRNRQGLEDVELSAGCLYGQINGGRDAGANLGDCFHALMKVGTCRASTIGHLEWSKSRRNTSLWQNEALDFRLDEAYLCDDVETFLTGIQLGFAGQFGLSAGSGFSPDSNGFMTGSNSRIDHAVTGCGMKRHANGKWYLEMHNSWGKNWGVGPLGGIGYYPISKIQPDELWLCRTTILTLGLLGRSKKQFSGKMFGLQSRGSRTYRTRNRGT